MRTRKITGLPFLLAILAGCVSTAPVTGEIPAYLTNETSCVLVVAVADPFQDKTVEKIWFAAKQAIAERLQNNLSHKYRSDLLIIDSANAANSMSQIGVTASKKQCNRVLQLVFEANSDRNGNFFKYSLNMFRAVPKARSSQTGTTTTLKGIYSKSYRYERNKEAMEKFSFDEFANMAFAELEASGQLEALRR